MITKHKRLQHPFPGYFHSPGSLGVQVTFRVSVLWGVSLPGSRAEALRGLRASAQASGISGLELPIAGQGDWSGRLFGPCG